jgi:hypothetical protein
MAESDGFIRKHLPNITFVMQLYSDKGPIQPTHIETGWAYTFAATCNLVEPYS